MSPNDKPGQREKGQELGNDRPLVSDSEHDASSTLGSSPGAPPDFGLGGRPPSGRMRATPPRQIGGWRVGLALAAFLAAGAGAWTFFGNWRSSDLSDPVALDRALRMAIVECRAADVRLLIARGADPNRVAPPPSEMSPGSPAPGTLPLQSHSRCASPATLQALLEGGADLAPHLRRLADLAMMPPRPSVMAWLLQHGLDPNLQWRNLEGWETLLHRAARLGQAALVEVLLQHGADPQGRDSEGLTPLGRIEQSIANANRAEAADPDPDRARIEGTEPRERYAAVIALLQEAGGTE